MLTDKRKKATTSKIRDACNQLVYLWKRQYQKSLRDGIPAPNPISIPKIATKARISAKTIYTNDDYKTIALTAIAKTTLEFEEETLEFYISKEQYSKEDVKQIVKNIKAEYELKIKEITSTFTSSVNEIEKLKGEINRLNNIINIQNLKIASLELENCEQKATLKLYNKSSD